MENELSRKRKAVDVAARRLLGFDNVSHVRRTEGSKSRRWTDPEIRAAVMRATDGKPITRHAYRLLRRGLNPQEFPSHNTAFERCPDLFV